MFTIGFDPEFFLVDGNGKFISAVGLVGGSKDNPLPIGSGCAVQEDNVAIEFNTPAIELKGSVESVAKQVHEHFQYVFKYIEETVCKPNGLHISKAASAIFDADQLQTEAAQTFGCDPDYNAYTGQENPKPKGPEGLRTCGGHIHIGYSNPDKETNTGIILLMDRELGTQSVLDDSDSRRRLLYGKAGAHRHKPYGVEYRTLSNYWIFDYESILKVIQKLAILFNVTEHEQVVWLESTEYNEEIVEQVQAAIDYNDKRLATYIQDNYCLEVAF